MASQKGEMSELEKQVRDLRHENDMKRVPISQSGADLLKFVQDHEAEDPVLNHELLASYPGRSMDSAPCCSVM